VLGYRLHDDGTDTNRGTNIDETAITAIDLAELRRRGSLERSQTRSASWLETSWTASGSTSTPTSWTTR
jgi:hypothetical protein